ncbi:MAG: sulfate transporter CysZ [Halothiobacillus sp.]
MNGFSYVLRGFTLMWRPGIRRFTLIPLAINIVLFGLGTWGAVHYAHQWLDDLLPRWLDWLSGLILPLLFISLMLVAYFSFTMIANFIAAPFNALLAQKLEMQLTGLPTPEDTTPLWQLAHKTLAAEWRKLMYFILWAMPLVIVSLIPVVNLAAPFLWFAFSAWMMALQYVDAPAGNHLMTFEDQRRWLRTQPVTSLSFGAAMTGMTLVPVLNFLALPVGVCAATQLWVDRRGYAVATKPRC